MIGLSKSLVVGAALGLVMGCGSSSPKAGGMAGAASGGDTSSGGAVPGGGPNAIGGAEPGGGTPGSSGGGTPGSSGGGTPGNSNGGTPGAMSSAAELAMKLRGKSNFLIGAGNDLNNDHAMDGAYQLGTTVDLHYAYLVGLMSKGGWADWNAGGTFVNVLTDTANAKGVTPMFTLYSMAAAGDGNLAGLSDDSYMKPYFDGLKLLYQRLDAFGKPAVVHFEPDFWAYAEQQSKDSPASMKVNVTANAPDCAGLSNDLIGLGHCMVKLARMYAPKAIIGFHASEWSADDSAATIKFLKAVGADQADIVIADMLDRDAGCFEAAQDPNCQRQGNFYWDETNQTSPNFHEYLAWAKAITSGLGRPMLWWQVPYGVPSATKGGTAGHYRDNRVHYIFTHIQEFIDAGGLGVTFGAGAENQTSPTTDGGQFKAAVGAYFTKPVALR
ncbi:MAG: hypothetical protein ABJB12_16115 [Pseudomonadota bacterium]